MITKETTVAELAQILHDHNVSAKYSVESGLPNVFLFDREGWPVSAGVGEEIEEAFNRAFENLSDQGTSQWSI